MIPINLAAVGPSALAVIPGVQAAETADAVCKDPSFLAGDVLTDNHLLRRAPMPAACDGNSGEKCVTGAHSPMAEECGLRATTIPALDGLPSLLLPDRDAALFGIPRLINGVSVTTVVMGKVRGCDDCVARRPGWTSSSTRATSSTTRT